MNMYITLSDFRITDFIRPDYEYSLGIQFPTKLLFQYKFKGYFNFIIGEKGKLKNFPGVFIYDWDEFLSISNDGYVPIFSVFRFIPFRCYFQS